MKSVKNQERYGAWGCKEAGGKLSVTLGNSTWISEINWKLTALGVDMGVE